MNKLAEIHLRALASLSPSSDHLGRITPGNRIFGIDVTVSNQFHLLHIAQRTAGSDDEEWRYWFEAILYRCTDDSFTFEVACMGHVHMQEKYSADQLRLRWMQGHA